MILSHDTSSKLTLRRLQNDPIWKTPINPTSHASDPIDTAAYNSALKAWERFRFVRAGWFRAKEAIDYIDYFYRHHAPLTPVALLDFRSYAKHEELLTNEPMLTITMLLIASRHMQLEGPGSVSRPYSIRKLVSSRPYILATNIAQIKSCGHISAA